MELLASPTAFVRVDSIISRRGGNLTGPFENPIAIIASPEGMSGRSGLLVTLENVNLMVVDREGSIVFMVVRAVRGGGIRRRCTRGRGSIVGVVVWESEGNGVIDVALAGAVAGKDV